MNSVNRKYPCLYRRGSLVIEAVISIALLATAGIALTRLSQNASVLNLQSDDRLALTLTAENTIDRLRAVPDQELAENAERIADAMSKSYRCKVEVDVVEFDGPGGSGLHLVVTATDNRSQRVQLHDWRVAVTGELPEEGDDES